MNSLRLSPIYHGSVPTVVPGVNVRSNTTAGPPQNCRLLLRGNVVPMSLTIDPLSSPGKEIHSWVLDWLTDYQIEAWKYAHNRSGSNLWHACGAGKTATAICWSLSARWEGPIIVVTKAPTKRQWKREVERLTTIHPTILYGQDPQKIEKDVRMVILSWEILPHWVGELTRWIGGGMSSVIFDEVHKAKAWQRKEKYVKEDGSVGWQAKRNISQCAAILSARAKRRLGLTATPVRDRLSDLWSQLDLVEPGCWGTNWEFVHRYCDAQEGKYGGLDTTGKSNIDELRLRFSQVCHVVSYTQMSQQLPSKRRQLCYLSREEQSRPSAFSSDLKVAARRGSQALFEMRLLEAASRKRKWIVETVVEAVENKQKVVVFTGRRVDCERIAEAIEKAKPEHVPLWWGHGGVSIIERDAMVAAYSTCEEASVFVGTTDAFGEAVDGLQHTDLAIFGLLPWTPGQVTQAEGRFSRQGSTRPVLIMYTVAEGTVDEHVADILLNKLEAVGEALEDDEAVGVAGTLAGEEDEAAIIANILAKANEG